MNPTEAYAFYILGEISSFKMVKLAEQWLAEGHDSMNICILAGETDPNLWVTDPLFHEIMEEFGINKPTKFEAAQIALKYHLQMAVEGEADVLEIGNKIYNDVYHKVWEEDLDNEYVGDGIGIEHICTWLREIWDCQDGGMILYHTDLPRHLAMEKFREYLFDAMKELYEKLK